MKGASSEDMNYKKSPVFIIAGMILIITGVKISAVSMAEGATQESVWFLIPPEINDEIQPIQPVPAVRKCDTEIRPLQPDVSGIEETYISAQAYSACLKYGREYNIAPELLMAMIETESRGIPDAENAGCIGLMQISEKWHRDRMARLGVTDLFDEDQNIHVGADYLAELFKEYEDIGAVLMIYNMGYDTAEQYYSKGIISEYATTITNRSHDLEMLHEFGSKRAEQGGQESYER